MLTSPIPKIMLVDMNSFFASVEQQANPFLRGKPVGVSPSHHPGSCLIGTSKEAKAMGIKNGFPLYKAKKIYPKIIVIESEPEKYREVNRQMNQIFEDYTPTIQRYSVDESFLDFRESKLNPLVVGGLIKRRIKEEVGEWLTCSVGIAQNRFLAKLAADLEKPDGLSVVWRENLPEIYKYTKLTDLWGINHGWENRLNKLGIESPLQLLGYPVQKLISAYGKPGFYIWQRVNGLEIDELRITDYELAQSARLPARQGIRNPQTYGNPKSFGHSWVLNFRTTDKEKLKVAILRLAEKAARRMRREGFVASGIYLSVRLADGEGYHRSKKLKFTVETGWQLYEEALKIWQAWKFGQPVMHIAVGFTNLKLKTNQLTLFPDQPSLLIPTLDLINDRYGEFTIRSALLIETADFAPDAIAFGR